MGRKKCFLVVILFITFSSCDVCGKTIEGRDCLPVVEAECACCGIKMMVCPTCKRRGCPVCGGTLNNAWAFQAKRKVPVRQIARGRSSRRRG